MAGLLRRIARTIRTTDSERAAVTSRSAEDTLREAAEHHDAGRMAEAEAGYRAALASDPEAFTALFRLGALYYETGRPRDAIPFMRRATEIRPDDAAAHANLGAACLAAEDLESAHSALQRSLALNPSSDVAQNILGAVKRARNDLAGARDCFEKANAINPRNAEAVNNLGNLAKESGDYARARDCYERAIDLNPRFADAFNNLGTVHKTLGNVSMAQQMFMQALEIQPNSAEALNNLGGVQQDDGKLEAAEECFRAALRLQPGLAAALQNLGNVLREMGRLEEAERLLRQAIARDPASADALSNLATVLGQRGDLAAAEEACRAALRVDAGCIAAHCNLGSVLRQRGDMARAEATYREALRLDPASIHTRYDLAILLLLRGGYEEGLELYENRFHCAGRDFAATRESFKKAACVPQWRGDSVAGKRIYVWSEQGLGDALMMMRYLPLLKARGAASITVECDPSLRRIVETFNVDTTSPTSVPQTKNYDVQCSIMSLPFLFGTRVETIPGETPYLKLPNTLTSAWAERLGSGRRLRVGLAWAGNRTLSDDARRSIPLQTLAPLFARPGIEFISLQKGSAAKQWNEVSPRGGSFIEQCEDFLDSAGLVANLGLVITVDTAIAHLAGALGRPVWLLNRFGSEWRWGLEREDTPWYPTMRQFRQLEPGDWAEVVARVDRALALTEAGQSSDSTKSLS